MPHAVRRFNCMRLPGVNTTRIEVEITNPGALVIGAHANATINRPGLATKREGALVAAGALAVPRILVTTRDPSGNHVAPVLSAGTELLPRRHSSA